jgi:hypothetical protein
VVVVVGLAMGIVVGELIHRTPVDIYTAGIWVCEPVTGT